MKKTSSILIAIFVLSGILSGCAKTNEATDSKLDNNLVFVANTKKKSKIKGRRFAVADEQGQVTVVGEDYSLEELISYSRPGVGGGGIVLQYITDNDSDVTTLLMVSISLEYESWRPKGIARIPGWYPYIKIRNGKWTDIPEDMQKTLLTEARAMHTSGFIKKMNEIGGEPDQVAKATFFFKTDDKTWKRYEVNLDAKVQ